MEARRRRREKEVRHEGEGLEPRRKRVVGGLGPGWRERERGMSSPQWWEGVMSTSERW